MTQLLLPIIYLAFISLGLPDSLLGSAWPTMYPQLGVPFSYAGILSMIISLGTIVSGLNSDRLIRALGTGRVTALSVGMTAAALFGFSVSGQFWMLCLWAVPYGLGAGSVDAALNNYVALHYQSRHMSWLHCMWGVGTTIGPVVMGAALSGGLGWNSGYRYIALFQIALTAVLFCSLPHLVLKALHRLLSAGNLRKCTGKLLAEQWPGQCLHPMCQHLRSEGVLLPEKDHPVIGRYRRGNQLCQRDTAPDVSVAEMHLR